LLGVHTRIRGFLETETEPHRAVATESSPDPLFSDSSFTDRISES